MFQLLLFIIPLIFNFSIHAEVKILLPKTPASFGQAKKLLYDDVYKDHRLTFYCGCKYYAQRVLEFLKAHKRYQFQH